MQRSARTEEPGPAARGRDELGGDPPVRKPGPWKAQPTPLRHGSRTGKGPMKTVVIPPTFEGWRDAARRLIADDVSPVDVDWREETPGAASMSAPGLFDGVPAAPSAFRVTHLLQLAGSAASHPDPTRWNVLYAVLYRLAHGEPELLVSSEDADVNTLRRLGAEARDGVAVGSPGGAAPFVPATEDLEELSRAAKSCRGCDLYRDATQTVFGQGPKSAKAALVGEQPGDQEDIQGAPFVGPAGAVLDRALTEAGLPRTEVWVTNAVKHFKFVRTPKRRLHQLRTAPRLEPAVRGWPRKSAYFIRRSWSVWERAPPRRCSVRSSASRATVDDSWSRAGRRRCSRPTTRRPSCGPRIRLRRLASTV